MNQLDDNERLGAFLGLSRACFSLIQDGDPVKREILNKIVQESKAVIMKSNKRWNDNFFQKKNKLINKIY